MKKRGIILTAICMLLGHTTSMWGQASGKIQFSNPHNVEFGDPYVLKASDGKFYMYGTSNGVNGFRAYSSKNLRDWKNEGVVYKGGGKDSWAVDCFWAPEVYERNNKFYMWYSANWKNNPNKEEENFKIGVAVANSPTGPFVEMNGAPLFDPGYPIIDANIYFDDSTGRVYLYYSRCCYKHPVESEISKWSRDAGWYSQIEESWIYGVEIKPDFSGIIGEPVLLLAPPTSMNDAQSEWESRSVTSKEVNRRWTEGSFLFKAHGTYYMLYSANYFGGENYAVGYATANHPLGSFTKSTNNPILQKNSNAGGTITGTGHCMVLTLEANKMLCVYHARTKANGEKRMVHIDEMEITQEGEIKVHGPTMNKTIFVTK